MKYVLLIDDDDDILNIQRLAVASFYPGVIHEAKNGSEALLKMQELGHQPELIISDFQILTENEDSLYNQITEKKLLTNLIICSGKVGVENTRMYPGVTAFINKPFSVEAFIHQVKNYVNVPNKPDFIPVKISVLLNFIGQPFDLFLRLSEINFVKYIKGGDPFTKEDCDRLNGKGVFELHLKESDSLEFLRNYESNLNLLLLSKKCKQQDKIVLAIDSLETIERFSKHMHWTPEVLDLAVKAVDVAVKIISQEEQISDILKLKLNISSSAYSNHIGVLAYLNCILSRGFGLGGATVQTKLTLAALLHDLTVDDAVYDNIKDWNKRATNPMDKSAEIAKYKLHPLEASRILGNAKDFPPDLVQILLQHHEKKDGSGFPRGLSGNQITPLTAFFIIVEDLVEFIGDGANLETSLTDFKMWGDAHYESGNFGKAYQYIRNKLA